MNRLFIMMIACLSLTFISTQLQAAGKSKEKNPFSSYFMKIERNEKKISKMDKKKDDKKIKALQEKIAKDKARLQKIVDSRTEEVDEKIEKLDKKLDKESEAQRDTTPILKQIHELNNILIKIRAWSKNEDPPELEEFKIEKPESDPPANDKKGDSEEKKGNDFDAEAFRKRMEEEK